MLKLSTVVISLFLASVASAGVPYYDTLPGHIKDPFITGGALYTPRTFAIDGAVSNVAVVYHVSGHDPIWPAALSNIGVADPSWSLLQVGAGGNTSTGYVDFGAGVNVAPSLLGPLVSVLNNAGGTSKTVGGLLVSSDGSGLNIGFGWKADALQNGGLVQFDKLRFLPRYILGYSKLF